MRRWKRRSTLVWLLLSPALVVVGLLGIVTPAHGVSSSYDGAPLTYDATVDVAPSHDTTLAVSAVPAVSSEGSAADAWVAVGHAYDLCASCVAPNSTRVFRAVEPDELADLVSSGQYRAGGPHAEWLDGKRFWLSQADADSYVALATKADLGGPYCVTSGCIPNSVLDQIQVVTMDGMDAVFLPNDLLPYIDDLNLPSPP